MSLLSGTKFSREPMTGEKLFLILFFSIFLVTISRKKIGTLLILEAGTRLQKDSHFGQFSSRGREKTLPMGVTKENPCGEVAP